MKGRRSQQLSPVGSPPSDNESGAISKEQERYLPIANVSRIMKKSLPTNAKISKEAKETVQECVSEFISFITGEASDKCQREKRKTINGDDLLWAMTTLGFENYVGPLKAYLSKYRETEGEKNSMARQGDSSPTDDNNHNLSLNHSAASTASLSGFNPGFYSMGPSAASQGFGGGGGGRMVGYADQSKIGAFEIGRINGDGEANGGRALPSYLHGVHWQ